MSLNSNMGEKEKKQHDGGDTISKLIGMEIARQVELVKGQRWDLMTLEIVVRAQHSLYCRRKIL